MAGADRDRTASRDSWAGVLGPSWEVCWVSGFAPARILGFGFRPATELGFRVSPCRRSWVSGFGGAGGETPLGADYVSAPATRGGARRPQPRRRQRRRDVPRQRRSCRERRASGHFGDQNSFGRVSCFTFWWVAVFRVSLSGRQRCFVFHFSPNACVSRVSCFSWTGGETPSGANSRRALLVRAASITASEATLAYARHLRPIGDPQT